MIIIANTFSFVHLQMQKILHMNLAQAIWLEKFSINTSFKMTSTNFHKASMYEPFDESHS